MSDSTSPSIYYSTNELQSLQNQGVNIPSIDHVCIGRDVSLENINPGVTLHPFCRIIGSRTKIFPNAQIGIRGAVTLENSIIGTDSVIGTQGSVTLIDTVTGPKTILGSGVAEKSVFLGKETMANDFTTGYGFRVRKGSLYEEDASSAQYTDTKMTILFPWVTLGSSINLCDLMITGGTGPELGKFTEIGSGTIHFNFTIRGDKATASLLGNATEGLFLGEKRVFISGNNSLIGPIQADFGVLTAAGIRASGELAEGLNLGRGMPLGRVEYDPNVFSKVKNIIERQIHYIGQLIAMYHWYRDVRFHIAKSNQEYLVLYQAGQKMLVLNIHERISQIQRIIDALDVSIQILSQQSLPSKGTIKEQEQLQEHWPSVKAHLEKYEENYWQIPELLLNGLEESAEQFDLEYTQIIQNLPSDSVKVGKSWLESIVHRCDTFLKSEMK